MTRTPVIAVLLAGIAAAGWFSWSVFRTPALTEPQAVESGPYRVVLDCLRPPRQISAELNGQAIEVPGVPTQFLVGEFRQGSVVAGWVHEPSAHPTEIVIIGTGATSLIGYCDRHNNGALVVEAVTDWTRKQGAPRLTIQHHD